jgi:hypothetical protein
MAPVISAATSISSTRSNALASGGKAWQVMVGSGGSPFSAKAGDGHGPTDRMYAWALVQVHASGKVQVTIRGFDDSYGLAVLCRRCTTSLGKVICPMVF